MLLNGRQMITFEVYRWNNAQGGMRFAFPPYGLIFSRKNIFLGLKDKKS
jgi:hypothetical protein